jgi:hypothetical protein
MFENKMFSIIINICIIFTLGIISGYKISEYKYLKMYNKQLIVNEQFQNKSAVINEALESSLLNQNNMVDINTQINYKTLYWLIKQHPEQDCYISKNFKDIFNTAWGKE